MRQIIDKQVEITRLQNAVASLRNTLAGMLGGGASSPPAGDTTASGSSRGDLKGKVLSLITGSAKDQSFTAKQVAELICESRVDTVRVTLIRLAESGAIHKVEPGVFANKGYDAELGRILG